MDSVPQMDQLWFSPEVVILRAQARTFRVFVDILKGKSTVFADMFTFPQPPSSDMETIDGVPVVALHDHAADVEVFLKAIFDSEFLIAHFARSTFEDTLRILRLAHKYDVPYLRRRALQHLAAIYPTQLSEYDCRPRIENPEEDFDLRITTIVTATEVGALWVLPVAYYELCSFELSTILEDPGWRALGDKERNACILGHSAQSRQFSTILDFLFVRSENCEATAACNQRRLVLTRHYYTKSISHSDPLDYVSDTVWRAMTTGMCEICVNTFQLLRADGRQKCWDALPEMFGLPTWEILEGMREVALST
ncbi:hypothetical protein C8R47DRAFT_1139202 [Mycena vitilis]|nr:hypothetical protein C8R47DRAFT_1139202 [Mycena vitilis]